MTEADSNTVIATIKDNKGINVILELMETVSMDNLVI
jgi:hypothetical protein